MKDAYYFPHDCNARHDPALSVVCNTFGLEAYSCFFMLIELLREQNNYKLPIKFKPAIFAVWKMYPSRILEGPLQGSEGAFEGLYKAFKSLELIKEDNDWIWSDSLIERMNFFDQIKEQQRESGRRGGLKSQEIRRSLEGALKPRSSDAKASKVKNSKVCSEAKRPLVNPTLLEVHTFLKTKNSLIDAEAFFSHYEANGWKQKGGNPIKNWKAAVVTWEKNASIFGDNQNGTRSKLPPKFQ